MTATAVVTYNYDEIARRELIERRLKKPVSGVSNLRVRDGREWRTFITGGDTILT